MLTQVLEELGETSKLMKKFSFQQITEDLVKKIILNLDSFKATPVRDITADMLKSTADIHLPFITKIINLSFENNCFPDDLELAEVRPVSKKKDDLNKKNYRPVSVLSVQSN